MVCEICNQLNEVPRLQDGEQLLCSNCHHPVVSHAHERLQALFCYSISALLLLIVAMPLPFLGFASHGVHHQIRLLQVVTGLIGAHFELLGALVSVFLLLLPLSWLIAATMLSCKLMLKRRIGTPSLLRWMLSAYPWLMADVFLVGALVALVKMHSLANIELLSGFWLFCLFCLLLLLAMSRVDKHWLWRQVAGPAPRPAGRPVSGCSSCGAPVRDGLHHCPRCHQAITPLSRRRITQTVALLLAALIMYIPANLFPIMQTTFLGQGEPSTIISGVMLLWAMGSYPVAIIILVASIIVPLLKILALGWLCWQSCRPYPRRSHERSLLYRLTEIVGRWSMIDIFVVAILSALVQLGTLMDVIPGPATSCFATVVILTMLAAMTFDPRLLWQPCPTSKQEHFIE